MLPVFSPISLQEGNDQHCVENVEIDQHFDCRIEVVENDEMDEQSVINEERVNPSQYSQASVNNKLITDSDRVVRTILSCALMIFISFAFMICMLCAPSVGCPYGTKSYNNNCYKFDVGTGLSWSGCKSKCASEGSASMLCIPDSSTSNWIAYQLSQQGYVYSWIGITGYNDGKYKWVSGCSSPYTYTTPYNYDYYYFLIKSDGDWYYNYNYGSSLIACSCEYYDMYISPSTRKNFIAIAVSIYLSLIFLILIYFFYKRANRVRVLTNNESPGDNDDISSSNQAYTDIPPATPYPPSDDDDDNNDNNNSNNYSVVILSSTEELQIVVATNINYNDASPMDHETKFIPIASQVY
jgi:hypothetical protein